MPKKTAKQRHSTTISSTFLNQRDASDESDDSSDAEAEVENMQLEDEETEVQPKSFTQRFTMNDMADLFELCKAKCPVRYLSTMVYMTMRSFGVSWNNCEAFLKTIG